VISRRACKVRLKPDTTNGRQFLDQGEVFAAPLRAARIIFRDVAPDAWRKGEWRTPNSEYRIPSELMIS
jgi:hypothetical protein